VIIPTTPPAFVNPVEVSKNLPNVSKRKVNVKLKNNAMSPPFDRNVAKNKRKVTVKRKLKVDEI